MKVNETQETAEPGVYAIGDIVAGLPQLAHVGRDERAWWRWRRLPGSRIGRCGANAFLAARIPSRRSGRLG